MCFLPGSDAPPKLAGERPLLLGQRETHLNVGVAREQHGKSAVLDAGVRCKMRGHCTLENELSTWAVALLGAALQGQVLRSERELF